MSAEPTKTPSRRGLTLAGALALIAAAAVAYTGISSRAREEQGLARWTDERAVPTVALVKPSRGAKGRELVLPGSIQAFTTAPLYARATGYVRTWNVDIGARVAAGDVLATLDTPELDQQLIQAKADLANAAAAEKLATLTAQRWHQLISHDAVSRQDLDTKDSDAASKHAAMQSAQANVARLDTLASFKTITAPFAGIITQRNIDVGNLVSSGTGTPLFQVADIHKVRVYVRVPQAFLAEIAPGNKAVLDLPQFPDRTFEATLVTTSNSVAEDSRTALVQLQADNANGKLWPGAFTEVHFQLPADPDALRVPATALIFGEHGMRVAVLDGDGKAAFKTVQLGRDLGDEAEIVSGLAASDQVIDQPPETLNSGDLVHVAGGGTDAPAAAPKVSATAPDDVAKAQ
jgi:RND family efflux transporter MFP subunit